MNHYKDSQNNFYGFEAGAVIPAGLTLVTIEEVNLFNEAESKKVTDNLGYAFKRGAEYPDFLDYLDGVVKGDQEQIDKYIADCLAVKAKYPKTD
jgi:hypothetical protein